MTMRFIRQNIWIPLIIVLMLGALVGLYYQQTLGYFPLGVSNTSKSKTAKGGGDARNGPGGSGSSNGSSPGFQSSELRTERWSPEIVSRQLATADEAIHEARYEHAANSLEPFSRASNNQLNPNILFKLAACRESLNQDAAALESYEKSLNATRREPLHTAARLGQCRIWTRGGKALAARNALFRSLLNKESVGSFQVEGRLVHELALTATTSLLNSSASRPKLSDQHLHVPHYEVAAEKLLAELARNSHAEPSASDSHEKLVRSVLKLDQSAEAILVDAKSGDLPVHELIDSLCTAAELHVQVDEACRQKLKKETTSVNFEGLPLALVLDALHAPLDCEWEQNNDVIAIRSVDQEQPAVERKRLERLIRFAISSAPDHELAPYSLLASAVVKQRHGQIASAVRDYQQLLERFPRNQFTDDIWMNLGKCYLLSDSRKSLTAFHRASDIASGNYADAIAKAYVGRISLREGDPEKAILPLERAISIVGQDEMQLDLQLLLSAAYLRSTRLEMADQTLQRCLNHTSSSQRRNEIAFLAGMIRLQRNDNRLRDRQSAELLSAAKQIDYESCFGEHWWAMGCEAFHALGFQDESLRLYERHRQEYSKLRICRQVEKTIRPAAEILNASAQNVTAKSHDFMQILENRLASESSYDEIIAVCEGLLQQPETSPQQRLEALRILGRVSQQRGDHDSAVKYLTADLNDQNQTSPTQRLLDQFPELSTQQEGDSSK